VVSTFDANGSFGLSTSLTNPAGVITQADAPRLTDIHRFRQRTIAGTRSSSRRLREHSHRPFRIHWTAGDLRSTWGLDDKIKTPYAYTLIYRLAGLPHGFSIEASYVGRLAHRGLIQEDLAMPLDLGGQEVGDRLFLGGTGSS